MKHKDESHRWAPLVNEASAAGFRKPTAAETVQGYRTSFDNWKREKDYRDALSRNKPMSWKRIDQYHLQSDPPGFTICRVNLENVRRYELWKLRTNECLASAQATDDVEAAKAVKHLKDVAEAV